MTTQLQNEAGQPMYISPAWNSAVCLIARCDGCSGVNVPAAVLTLGVRPHKWGGYAHVPIEATCSACGTSTAVVCCESLFGDRRCPDCAPGPLVNDTCHLLHVGDHWPGGACHTCNANAATLDGDDYDHTYDSVRAGDFD